MNFSIFNQDNLATALAKNISVKPTKLKPTIESENNSQLLLKDIPL